MAAILLRALEAHIKPSTGTADEGPRQRLNYGYIQRSLLPSLRDNGVTDDQIDQMTRRNPREFFAARSGSRTRAAAVPTTAEA